MVKTNKRPYEHSGMSIFILAGLPEREVVASQWDQPGQIKAK